MEWAASPSCRPAEEACPGVLPSWGKLPPVAFSSWPCDAAAFWPKLPENSASSHKGLSPEVDSVKLMWQEKPSSS